MLVKINFSGDDKFTDVHDQLSLIEKGKYCKMIKMLVKINFSGDNKFTDVRDQLSLIEKGKYCKIGKYSHENFVPRKFRTIRYYS